jgi:AcrR family transcriptional regulator
MSTNYADGMRPRQVSDDVLLECALSAFAEDGYDGASVRAVCRRLDVSHNMVNKRYGSKDALWYAAVDHGFRWLVSELAEATAAASDDPFDQLRSAMLRFVAVTRARPALAQILYQESARPGPRFDYLFKTYVAPINAAGLKPLKQLQAEGRVRPGPVTTTVFHLVTYGLGVMSSHPEALSAFGDDGTDPIEASELAVDMVLDSLRPRD